MKSSITLLLGQLLIKNIISLIQSGRNIQKDATNIALNSTVAVLILVIYFIAYNVKKFSFITKLLIQVVVVLHFEISIYENLALQNLSVFVYLIQLQLYLLKGDKFFSYFSHAVILYFLLRPIVRAFEVMIVYEIVLVFLWQPFNHYYLYLKRQSEPEITKKEESTPNMQTQTLTSQHYQQTERGENLLAQDDQNEDFFNCIPEGLVILDEHQNIVKHNSKILQYLRITESNQIAQALDGLLKMQQQLQFRAQVNRTPMKEKYKKQIMPLKCLKQYSQQANSLTTSLRKQFWLSDRLAKDKTLPVYKGDSILFPFLQLIINDLKSKNSLNENMTVNSESLSILKYQVTQEVNLKEQKQRHLSIKIYEIAMPSYSQTPVYLFIIENITNKEKLKLMTSRFKFQQSLLNSFSHELRTPLNCTLSLMQALKSKLINEEINRQYLNPAIVSSQRLLFQINDILDYAQIECNDFRINTSEFRVGEIFQTLEDFFVQECSQKQIELIIDCDNQVTLRSDKDRITQILINLMNNSIKFTPQNGRIIVNIKKRDSLYQFTVWDNGKGISNLTLANIFDSQNGIGNSVKLPEAFQSSNKLGLGLKVSRGIARSLCSNGDLIIKSQQGSYTSVSFFIEEQVFKINEDITDQESYIKLASKNNVQKCECPQALIVDDVPFNHIAMIAMLKNFGIKSESAYDGAQAIDKVNEKLSNKTCCKVYRLIFMDIEMPGKNGFQTSQEIVEILKQSNQQSVIVMCSAYTGEENVEQARNCGMKEIVPKPISMAALQLLISKYFS